MLQRQQHLLVVGGDILRLSNIEFLLQEDCLGGVVNDYGADNTGEENHHHYTVKHVGVEDIGAVGQHHVHAHHGHGNASGGMCLGETEHHVTGKQRGLEDEA